jgi:hypothetical protein
MSIYLIKTLIVFYAVILGACLIDRDWKMALYWIGAIVIQTSVLLMRVK